MLGIEDLRTLYVVLCSLWFCSWVYSTARRIKKDSGISKKRFNPASRAQTGKIRFRMVYHDIGFLTDSEFQSVVGASNGSCRGREQVEDRGDSVQGIYVSLRVLPKGLLGIGWIM